MSSTMIKYIRLLNILTQAVRVQGLLFFQIEERSDNNIQNSMLDVRCWTFIFSTVQGLIGF